MVPTSRVSIDLHGQVPVTEAQIRAALDDSRTAPTRAYAPLTVHVCTPKRPRPCRHMGRGEASVILRDAYSSTDVSPMQFEVPQCGDHDGPRYPDASEMVDHSVESAQTAGQEAGQVSAAVHAAIEAQGLNFSRSPVWWGWTVAGGLVLACVLGFRHRRRARQRQALHEQLATASRQLSTVLLQLETTELAAVQLNEARAKRGSASVSAKGNQQVTHLRRRQGQLVPRSVGLLSTQRDLESRLPRGLPTMADVSPVEVKKFADGCASLAQASATVMRGATLLSDSAGSLDVWDAEADPLIRAGALIQATLERTGHLDEAGVPKALADLEDVRQTVLAAGAARADRAADADRGHAPGTAGPTPSSAQIASEDLDVLVKQSRRVDSIVQRLIFGALKPRVYRMNERDLPKDLIGLPAISGVRLRSEPTWEDRPLVADRLAPTFERGEVPMTAAGLCDWWEDSVQQPEQVAIDRERTQRAQEREKRRKALSPGAKRVRGVISVVAVIVVFVALIFGIVGFGWMVGFAKDAVSTSGRNQHITVVHTPNRPDFPSVDQLQKSVGSIRVYTPLRIAVVTLPADDADDKAAADQSRQPDPAPGRPMTLALQPLSVSEQPRIARATVRAVRWQAPQLFDARTGDLKHDAMVLGVRPVSIAPGKQYRAVSLVWGPMPAVERTGGYSRPLLPNSTDIAESASYSLVFNLRQEIAEQFGAPRWISAPATTALIAVALVGIVVGVITLITWLRGKPWRALGAGGRRRRDSDRLLAATTQALLSAYSREDEASLDALLAANAAGTMPDDASAPSARPRTEASGTGNVPAASIEAERERVLTRTQASALRRAEELASYTSEVRSTAKFADDVQDLADLVSGLQNEHQDTQGVAERYLSTLLT